MNELNHKCIDWLLSSNHPSIRYLTKTNLLKEKPTEMDRHALTVENSPIAQIMHELKDGRYWVREQHFYSPKYMTSHWSLLLLHEYACPAETPQIYEACEYLLELSYKHWLTGITEKNHCDHELSCFFGNVVRYGIAFGFAEHPYIQAMIDYLSESKEGKEWCCIHNQNRACLWGAIRSLYAFANLPERLYTAQVRESVQSALQMVFNCAEMLTAETLSPSPKEHTLWGKLNFPLYYQADKLFTLRVLREHKQLQNEKLLPVLMWLQARRKSDGTWKGSNPYKSRSWPFAMDNENIHQWVSLQALTILVDAGLEKI